MTITDKAVIDRVMRGDVREVSAGYRVSYDATPGVTDDGEHYDGIQKAISGNHVAIVRRGRAGPEVKALDAKMLPIPLIALRSLPFGKSRF